MLQNIKHAVAWLTAMVRKGWPRQLLEDANPDRNDWAGGISKEQYEAVRAQMLGLALLRSPEARTRDRACRELSDFFEYRVGGNRGNGRLHIVFQNEIREAMEALIDVAVQAPDSGVIESALFALSAAVNFAHGANLVDWEPLVANLAQLERVDYVLPLLAATGNSKYRAVITQFLADSREDVRVCAEESLIELDFEMNAKAGRLAVADRRFMRELAHPACQGMEFAVRNTIVAVGPDLQSTTVVD